MNVKEREIAVAGKEEELRKREEALMERETKIDSREMTADEKMREGELAESIFREKEGILPEISTRSLERDEFIKQSLQTIKETAEKIRQITLMNNGRGMTLAEEKVLKKQKLCLRAALLATVCVYRDSLPELDRLAFSINGKSCSTFLQEQAKIIEQETEDNHLRVEGGTMPISEEALKIIDSTYKRVASGMGAEAGPAYKGAYYTPFEGTLGFTDSNNAGPLVFKKCLEGADVGVNLTWGGEHAPRSTLDVTQTTSIEKEIDDIAKTTDEWEK